MHFWKMHGTGNDYIYVDASKETIEQPEQLAVEICKRRFGIGADGLILLHPSKVGDVRMEMYNADGTRGSMCGNGIRCAARFAYEQGLVFEKKMQIETDCGLRQVELLLGKKVPSQAVVDMGEPIIEAGQRVKGIVPILYPVSVGNPHGVMFDLFQTEEELTRRGQMINRREYFPEGINVEFVQVIDRQNIQVQVWERGSGFTLSCGTGAVASAALCMEKGMTEEKVQVHLPGGSLIVWKEAITGHFFLQGPAEKVYEGNYEKN